MKFKNQFCFLLLIIIYTAIGYYNIQTNAITSDEPAYLGAAYAYSQGVGLNQEHPLFLKLLNSLLFSWQFPNLKVDLPNPTQLDSKVIRLAAFDVGYQLLMYFPEQFERLVESSRSLYFGINSLLLVWIGLYSFILKLINPKIALIFITLWIFSPSFASHNGLITFDVGVAVSALITILSLTILVYSITQLLGQYLIWQFAILSISLTFAINTKFSNLLLLPIVIIALVLTSFRLFKTQKKSLAIKFTWLSIICLGLQPIWTLAMYRFAFCQLPNQSLSDIIERYLTGIQMTLITTKGEQTPFLWGEFRPVNYGQYISQIIWFKENPWLFLILGLILFSIFKFWQKSRNNLTSFFKGVYPSKARPQLYLGLLILLISAYPIAYFWLAKSSHFVIGYRYFYPVLLFLYFLIAVLAVSLQSYYSKKILIISLILYSLTGAIAVPQTLSYVNPFWLQDKWLLVNDSTLNWGQENRQVVSFLLENKLLPKENQNTLIQQTFGVVININQYLEVLTKLQNYPLNIQSYYETTAFEPLKDEIITLPYRYLLIDSTVTQTLYAERGKTAIADQNWNYLENHQPIYSHNDIMFIYQLH